MESKTRKAVFLDRDGTIIVDKVYLNDPSGVEFFLGVPEALAKLQKAGFLLIVITNQSGIARGLVTEANLKAIHDRMQTLLKVHGVIIDAFYHSPHAADSNHPMRKPNPGMFVLAAQEHRISLTESFMIGDKAIDVEAGQRAGAKSILLSTTLETTDCRPDFTAYTLPSAVQWILEKAS